jgi:hypothetical protein
VTNYVKADNTMNRKSKSLFTLTGVTLTGLAVVVILSGPQSSLDDKNVFCRHSENVVLDLELPVSHLVNRCATDQSHGISWSSWFSGHSSSYQFHFIDLLELLSRPRNNEAQNPTTTN